MKIIFSPTKTMQIGLVGKTIPKYENKAKEIIATLKMQSKGDLGQIWHLKGKLLDSCYNMLLNTNFSETSSAITSYNGLSFKHLDYLSLNANAKQYIDENLRIISGVYGVLLPTDSIINYRLEMNYASKFWGDEIARNFSQDELIINLASKEYSTMLSSYGINIVNINFYVWKNEKFVMQSTESKIMRGQMARYLAVNQVKSLTEIKRFKDYNYQYSEELSNESNISFVKR